MAGTTRAEYEREQKDPKYSANFWPKAKGDPDKVNPAPPGWDWVPIPNAEGVFVGWWLTRDTSEGNGGGGGGGGGTTYVGGGGGGGGNPGLSAYIQAYRIMFDNANVKPPKDLLKKAEAGNWSIAYWNMMVRLNDKAYFSSAEAKRNLAELRNYWKAVLPGVKLNKAFARDYLRHGWTATQLQNKISQLPSFKRQYPFWQAFAKAQRQQGAAKMVNPLAYKALWTGFQDVYKQAGTPVPTGYGRLFFQSGLTDEEFTKNYAMLAEGANAARWDVGGLSAQQQQAELFNQKGASQVRGLLQIALNKQQQYMRAQPAGFRLGEAGNLITMKGI